MRARLLNQPGSAGGHKPWDCLPSMKPPLSDGARTLYEEMRLSCSCKVLTSHMFSQVLLTLSLQQGNCPLSPPPPPRDPHVFSEQEDTTGQVKLRNDPEPSEVATVAVTPISRTTEWRRRKKAAALAAAASTITTTDTPAKPRKEYTCRHCKKAMSSPGHTLIGHTLVGVDAMKR